VSFAVKNRKLKMRYYFYIFAVLSIFFSCQSRQNRDNNKYEINKIVFERFIVDSVYLFTQSPNLELQIVIKYPVNYCNPVILDSLQRFMTASAIQGAEFEYDYRNPENFLQKFADYKIDYFRKFETPDHVASFYSYTFTSDTDSVFCRSGIFCFVTYIYYFSGGAHGMYGTFYTCVDLETGRKLAFNDVFAKGNDDALTAIIKRVVEDEAEGDYFVSEIKPSNNFYFDVEGIVFVYNPYEIAPYYLGIIEIFVPFDEIVPLFLPETPVQRLIIHNF